MERSGYRFAVDPYVTWLTKYAELASTGSMKLADIPQFIEEPLRKKLETLEAEQGSTEWANMKAQDLMTRFLERVNSKVDQFAKDSYQKAMSKIIASVMPMKTKTGAPQKSRALDADATRTVKAIAESMALKEDELNGKLAAIEQESDSVSNDPTLTNQARRIKLAELETAEMRLKTFGFIEGMDSATLSVALGELVKFVSSGRESWANKIEDRLARLDAIADRIVKELPEASDADLQKARSARSEDENGETERGEKSPIGKFFTGLYNFPNFIESLGSLKPLKEEYQQRMIDEQNRITDKTLALQRRMNSAIVEITGGKKIREITAWLGNNKIVKNTGITYITRSMAKGQLTIQEARKLIESNFKTSDKTENERIAIREAWQDYEAKGMSPNRKYISYTFEESQKTGKLFASKWEDYIAGIALGAWNGIALLGGLGEGINMLTAELGWTNKAKFGGAGRAIFDPVGAAKSIGKIVKMATDDKDDSWIDYTKGSLNAVKSGAIAGGTLLKATAKGGEIAEQAFAGLMAAAGASNVAKFGVTVADKLDLQDTAKDIKEAKAQARREAKKARED